MQISSANELIMAATDPNLSLSEIDAELLADAACELNDRFSAASRGPEAAKAWQSIHIAAHALARVRTDGSRRSAEAQSELDALSHATTQSAICWAQIVHTLTDEQQAIIRATVKPL